MYERDEKEKRDKYEEGVIESETGSFSPMVFLTNCGTGPDATVVLKRLAEMVSNKRAEKYSHVISYIRTRIRFDILRSVLIAIRVRGSIYKEKTLGKSVFNLIPQSRNYDV